MHVHAGRFTCMCVCSCVGGGVCARAHTYVFLCILLCEHVHACVFACRHAHVCVCGCTLNCTCVCVCVCVCVCLCWHVPAKMQFKIPKLAVGEATILAGSDFN